MTKTLSISILVGLAVHHCFGESKITFYLKPYPLANDSAEQKRVSNKMQKPNYIAKQALKSTLEHSVGAGIYSLYAGYLGISNDNGQTTFPRKHTEPLVKIIVTAKATPVTMIGNTVHHWEIQQDTPAQMFSLERKKDAETGLYIWECIEEELPNDRVVPREGIIIFVKPKNIYIPTGVTVTTDSEHLILPDFYLKRSAEVANNALYILNLKHFFGNINLRYKTDQKGYATHLDY